MKKKQFVFQAVPFRAQTPRTAHRNSSTKFHEEQQRSGRAPTQRFYAIKATRKGVSIGLQQLRWL